MEDLLLYYSLKYDGNYQKIKQALKNNEPIEPVLFDILRKKCHSNYVVLTQSNYPISFYDLKEPPFVVYYYGDIDLVNTKTIGIIGTRIPTFEGKRACDAIVRALDEDVVVVSGLAIGIDSRAQYEAMRLGRKVIGVLGSGIDCCYPKASKALYDDIKEKGLVMSEYPFDVSPQPYFFLWRNRLVGALSNKLLIVEASIRSGTMNTASHALELGRDVYCVPGRFGVASGCNQLIKEGAILCDTIEDLL